MPLTYQLLKSEGEARAGLMTIRGIEVQTPCFMPVGTNGTVKAMPTDFISDIGYNLILGNTYHLHLRPGDEVVGKLGGLHQFMNWDKLILTDSGGFQVFSLAKLNKVTAEGVHFQSHLDGNKMFLSPQKAIQIQENLNSDIMMVLDECLAIPTTKEKVAESIKLTTNWAAACLEARKSTNNLFAIVQGADFEDLRKESALSLMEHDFDGFAIGGLSVGEAKEVMYGVTQFTAPILPKEKPRYLMGVGTPEDLLMAIESGVDMFDCVMPTRNARNGSLFTKKGMISIKRAEFKEDSNPVEDGCGCMACKNYSKAYLRHIYLAGEILSSILNTAHNLYFYKSLMEQAREAILKGEFQTFKKDFLAQYNSK
ncbi:MAG: tRNA guanosine(34) transglycosylase Tgt [SAR324 cluster bacterium]|nr:tRNA guanosine(34) transglycosylase Tgt [SAR324 cluster bacterium]